MTREEILSLEDCALDAAIAERVCGWRRINGILVSSRGGLSHPRYSADLNACRDAELLFISTRAKHYTWALIDLIFAGEVNFGLAGPGDWLLVAMADAATRCRAMLLALEEAK